MFKVGMWLKHKHTGDLLEITDKKWHKQGFYIYYVVNHAISNHRAYEWYDTEINNLTTVSPMARLLYSSNSNKRGYHVSK